jgi:hypothetical protein
MTAQFTFAVTPEATELSLIGPEGPVPFDRWPVAAPVSLRPGVDLAQRLEAAGSAASADAILLIEHSAVAGLTPHEASLLGLPPAAAAAANISTSGVVTRPDYRVSLRWQRPTGQAIAGVDRVGAWLTIGDQWCRLPDPLFSIAEAVDAAEHAGDDPSARLAAVAALLELLPDAQKEGDTQTTGMLGTLKVYVADAFSLDLEGDGEKTRLVPVLHRASGDPTEPLLSEQLHDAFAHRQFNGFGDARGVYTLGGGNMLVLSPPLRRALSVVRRLQSAAPATRLSMFANPRAYLREALGDENETLIDNIFRDTPAYSERVIGLGLWQPRVVPWVQVASTDWFAGADTARAAPPVRAGLLVGDVRLDLTPAESDDLRERVEQAIGAGEQTVELLRPDGPIVIPATYEVLIALAQIDAARARLGDAAERRPPAEVLLIHPNEETLAVEALVSRRPTPPPVAPTALATPPKEHQSEGLGWLQKAWAEGLPCPTRTPARFA